MKAVVDTNVAIAANGRDTHASLQCQLACVELLESLIRSRTRNKIYIDASGQIMTEYEKHLYHRGEPGMGDRFYKYLHDYSYADSNVQLVEINAVDDEATGFLELPVNKVDKSDRKFLAVAVAGKATIVNATDSDWSEQSDFLTELGVEVAELCPDCCGR